LPGAAQWGTAPSATAAMGLLAARRANPCFVGLPYPRQNVTYIRGLRVVPPLPDRYSDTGPDPRSTCGVLRFQRVLSDFMSFLFIFNSSLYVYKGVSASIIITITTDVFIYLYICLILVYFVYSLSYT
jgi:hypothetical protein